MKAPSQQSISTSRYSPTLFHRAIPSDDHRLLKSFKDPSISALSTHLKSQRESLSRDRVQLYHFAGATSLLIPVTTPPSTPSAKLALHRLHLSQGGPRTILMQFNGAIGPGTTISGECLNSITISSSTGKNRITLRPTEYTNGRRITQVYYLEIDDEDEDDGFWGAIGDFFGGIIDGISDFFESLWDWIKETAEELWEQIKRGLARVFVIDDDEDGQPDGVQIEKEIPF